MMPMRYTVSVINHHAMTRLTIPGGLTQAAKCQIVFMIKHEGYSSREVARAYETSKTNIENIYRRYRFELDTRPYDDRSKVNVARKYYVERRAKLAERKLNAKK